MNLLEEYLEGRRFSDGLHQALEAKEKVEIQMKIKRLHRLLIKITLDSMKNYLA